MTTGLEVTDLTVTYAGTPARLPGGQAARRRRARGDAPARVAVDHATFHVDRGESLALVGASGSGKSSLLLALAGVVEATGSIRWDGEEVSRVPAHRRGFGLVFQDGQLFPHLSVADNIGFGLELRRVPRAEREARVAELLDMIDLPGAGSRAVTELSGGERQRVALARTLAPKPRLVLLDEPLSALDADLRVRLGADVRRVLEDSGASWIVVTHDAAEAGALADRTLRMDAGVLGSV